MEDDQNNTNLETSRADRSVWLMKCPVVVAKAWNSIPADSQQNLSKVVVSVDPLHPQDPSSLQFTMEMAGQAGSGTVNMPNSYSLNMFKDFVPMCVFSEANPGRVAMEGKVEHKFDMKPHNKNMEYSRMCPERTNKSMIKNRQIQFQSQMAGTSRPSSSSNPPSGSQIMPPKLRAAIQKTEQEIKELYDIYTLKEKEKHEIRKSIVEKKATVRSINKDIRKEERKLNLIEQEFPMLDKELRDKYNLVNSIKEIYPEDP